jgi:hypothetical protein
MARSSERKVNIMSSISSATNVAVIPQDLSNTGVEQQIAEKVANPALKDLLAMSKDFLQQKGENYKTIAAKSIDPKSQHLTDADRADRAKLIENFSAWVVGQEKDCGSIRPEEAAAGQLLIDRMSAIVNNPAYKFSDVEALANTVIRDPGANMGDLGVKKRHVETFVLRKMDNLLRPLDDKTRSADNERKTELAIAKEMNRDIDKIFGGYFGNPVQPSATNNTFNTSVGSNNTSNTNTAYVPIAQPLAFTPPPVIKQEDVFGSRTSKEEPIQTAKNPNANIKLSLKLPSQPTA